MPSNTGATFASFIPEPSSVGSTGTALMIRPGHNIVFEIGAVSNGMPFLAHFGSAPARWSGVHRIVPLGVNMMLPHRRESFLKKATDASFPTALASRTPRNNGLRNEFRAGTDRRCFTTFDYARFRNRRPGTARWRRASCRLCDLTGHGASRRHYSRAHLGGEYFARRRILVGPFRPAQQIRRRAADRGGVLGGFPYLVARRPHRAQSTPPRYSGSRGQRHLCRRRGTPHPVSTRWFLGVEANAGRRALLSPARQGRLLRSQKSGLHLVEYRHRAPGIGRPALQKHSVFSRHQWHSQLWSIS